MAIQLEIPMSSLQRPGVASALAQLVQALGGGQAGTYQLVQAAAPSAATAPQVAVDPSRPTRPSRAKPPTPMNWKQFEATLTPATRQFLRLIKENGHFTMPQAVKALNMKANKSMGGLTGALARKATRVGLELPYRQSHNMRGERMWVWRDDFQG